MSLRSVFIPVVALLALTTLGGCSFGMPASPAGPGGETSASPTRTDPVAKSDPSSSGPASGGDAVAGGSGGAHAANFPCNLYTLSSISDLAGFKVVRAQPITAVGEPDQKSCEYSTSDGSHSFATEIALSNAQGHLQTWSLIENTGAAVADVGDSAWGGDSELAAVFGTVFVEAGDESDASNEDTPLAHIGLDKLTLMVSSLYAATLKG